MGSFRSLPSFLSEPSSKFKMEKLEKVKDPGDSYPTHRDDFVWKSGTQWLRAKVKNI